MTKYLEQRGMLVNPILDRRKHGRWAKPSFPAGTRWFYDEEKGRVYDDRMELEGKDAQTIVANCNEVEPGFAGLLNEQDCQDLLGQLIDQGKINISDVQDYLREDEHPEDEEDEIVGQTKEEFRKSFERQTLDQEQYRYRHWLSLDPPNDTLKKRVAEQERIDAIKDEYAERTQQGRSNAADPE